MEVMTYNVLARENYHLRAPEKKSSLKMVVPLAMSFIAGTGGSMTAQSAEAMGRWMHTPAIHVGHPSQKLTVLEEADAFTPAEHVLRIRDTLSLNMTELAEVLNVSRPTAYAWLDGQEPNKNAILEIRYLSEIAEKLNGLSIARMDKLVRRPIFGSLSFLDKLKTKTDIEEALITIEKLSIKESQARGKVKGSGKNRRSAADTAREYSTPTHGQG